MLIHYHDFEVIASRMRRHLVPRNAMPCHAVYAYGRNMTSYCMIQVFFLAHQTLSIKRRKIDRVIMSVSTVPRYVNFDLSDNNYS